MKRVILMAYTNHNFGDDLFLYTICKSLPDVRFYLFSSDDYRKQNTISNLHIYPNNKGFITKLLKTILPKKADALVFVGGSLFGEMTCSKIEVTEESIHDRLISLSNGMYDEKLPFFLLGCNFGPFQTENYRLLHEKTFERLQDVCFRDRYSYSLFSKSRNIRYAPDIVFNLYGSFHAREEKQIVISVWGLMEPGNGDTRNKYYKQFYKQYREKLIEIVKYFYLKGEQICLMSFCGAEGDELICERILRSLTNAERGHVKTFFYQGDIGSAIRCMEHAKFIIATRFHAMILGWLMQKAVFPISYECKTENVIKDTAFKGRYAAMEEIGKLSMEDVAYNYLHHIVPDISALAEQSKDQFKQLKKYFRTT